MSEEYITLNEAVKRLKLSKSTISRIIKKNSNEIPTKADKVDSRLVLVEYNSLKRIITESARYKE